MLINGVITVYHINANEEYDKAKTYSAHVYNTYAGQNDRGIKEGSKLIARFSKDAIVSVGDKVVPYTTSDAIPPKDAYKVMLVRVNAEGFEPHVRVEAVR